MDTIHMAAIPWIINALPLGAISFAIGVNTDTSNQLINVSNRTRSTQQQSRELSTPLTLGAISLAMSTGQEQLIVSSTRDTEAQAYLSNKLLIDLYQIPRYDLSPNSVQMNNGFYLEVYKHRSLIMYNVLQIYRISCYSIFITYVDW